MPNDPIMPHKSLAFLFLCLLLATNHAPAYEQTCSYTTYKWNTHARQAVDFHRVQHPYSELQPEEIHAETGCTVCEQDQVEIEIPGIRPFRVCKLLAQDIRYAIINALDRGDAIFSVQGYRVGMTKGDADADGNRTRFSNHSFGIAIDINQQQNGLYDQCLIFGPACRLRRGGPWKPGQAGSLTRNSPVVQELERIGLKWGGEIEGKQKDFMHFSPSGY